jgi:thiol-disulfide isomerase/thioredoxin
MKKKLIIVSIIAILGVLIWIIIQNQSSETANKDTDQSGKSDISNIAKDKVQENTSPIIAQNSDNTNDNTNPGMYATYDSSLLAKADNGDVVLFFRASWCPTCRALDTDIKANQIPDGLTILDINYDDSTELRKKYGVTVQHTLVKVNSKGELIKKWSGGNTLDTILKQI